VKPKVTAEEKRAKQVAQMEARRAAAAARERAAEMKRIAREARQRERKPKLTPEEKRAKRIAYMRAWRAAAKVVTAPKSPAPAPAPVRSTSKRLDPTQRLRMQRRELAASYRSPTKPMPAAREQANLRWAEQEAERMAMEERDRLERRARDWKLRGAAAGIGA
jgi:hypothetical protein